MTVGTKDLLIRAVNEDDLACLVNIETLNTDRGWTLKQFVQAMDCTHVLCINRTVVGFFVMMIRGDQSELHNISVHPRYQNRGYGRFLLNRAVTQLDSVVSQVFLEVRISNFRAISLYNSFGFIEIDIRRDYYPSAMGREDAVVMCLQR